MLGLTGLVLSGPRWAEGHAIAETEEQRIAGALQTALSAHGADVNRCFEKALADKLDVSGKLELEVDVGDAGKVTKASPAVDEVKSPVLLACLQESAVLWTLAGIDAGSKVILPLTFSGQMAQFSVKAADAPDHGPPGPPAKHKGAGGPPGPAPPFSVKLLVDEATMRARQASLSLLTVSPANRIAMHKHPGAEVLYVTKGHARILGPSGTAPEKIDEGMAIYIPPGMPHAIENMGRQTPAVMLQVFAPLGPERVYRDPKDPTGRAAFEVIRDSAKAVAPPGAHFVVASAAKAEALPLPGGKASARMLLDEAVTGSKDVYLGLLEAEPGAEVPRHNHPGSAEILYVLSGGGQVTIGSETMPFGPDQAIQIPEGQPHAGKFTGPPPPPPGEKAEKEKSDKTVVVQIYAPAGPEQRFKKAPEKK